MGRATEHERAWLLIPVKVPWFLGTNPECMIDGEAVTLRNAATGGELRLARSDFVRRRGRLLDFHSRAVPIGDHCIEFAELGRDARYEVIFPDEATAAMVAARIQDRFDNRP